MGGASNRSREQMSYQTSSMKGQGGGAREGSDVVWIVVSRKQAEARRILERHFERSMNRTYGKSVVDSKVSKTGRDITWNHLVHSSVSPLLIEISRKGLHVLESSICRQVAKMAAKVKSPVLSGTSQPILTPVKHCSQP
ncbi:hypothetical protein AVEN_244329-1 [Araneus ventricosus]|uniref:Uncharacterized protein n=1 Tax=Araneus ventricosus TaxID=182803 RepID=A0A4Y2SKL9_ARAVE|nr:hypothetical protein AVEN_129330-1 [Araneus ventricosus]GBN88773.1 hypothetical protein AVEN_244329-1 [Araneus ventricosus]